MINTKYIKITISVITILVIVFAVLFINNNNKTLNTNNNETNEPTDNVNRPIFDTKVNNFSTTTTQDNIIDSTTEDYTNTEGQIGQEDVISRQIKQKLFNWNITKDIELLKESIKLTEGADNEVVLGAWRDFMSKNSTELIKVVNTSSDGIKTKETVKLILEWYIDLSGDYEKLSSVKKQEISNQYKQLK